MDINTALDLPMDTISRKENEQCKLRSATYATGSDALLQHNPACCESLHVHSF